MDNKIDDDEDNYEKILCEAMLKAKEAFFDYIMKEAQLDGAYFEIKLIGYELDVNFERMNQVVMKTPETKERRQCECDINDFVAKSPYEDPNSSQYVG